MIAYLIRRTIYGASVLWGVATLIFIIFSFKPGDPAQMLLGQRATPEAIAAVERELGLDLSLPQQYLLYLNDISPISIHSGISSSHLYVNESREDVYPILYWNDHYLAAKAPYLRRSYRTKKYVTEIITEAFPGTLILACGAILFAILVGMTFGVLSALYRDGPLDRSSLIVAVLGMSSPSFYMAIIISWLGGVLWYESIPLPMTPLVLAFIYLLLRLVPRWTGRTDSEHSIGQIILRSLAFGIGLWILLLILRGLFGIDLIPMLDSYIQLPGTYLEPSGSLYEVDVFTGPELALRNLILPMLTLGIRPLAIIIQLTRNALLEELSKDYVRTAKAKGLPMRAVVVRHALRNALNPVVTAVSGWFASLLAGAVFIEFIFGWKGLGLQVFEALVNEDLPLVMGSVLVISSIFVLINLLVDILYGVIDPRVRIT